MANILLVARTLPWHIQGGMETHAWQLSRALARAGNRVHVYTTSYEHRRTQETRDGVHITYLPHLPRDHAQRPFWRIWGRFAKAAEREFRSDPQRYDLILSEMFHAWRLFAHPKARTARRVFILHGTTAQDYRYDARPKMLASRSRLHPRALGQALWIRGRVRRERNTFLPRADAIVAVSPWVAHNLQEAYRVPSEKIHIIGNGIEPPSRIPDRAQARRELGLDEAPWILYLGRLEDAKGPQRAVQTLEKEPGWRLAIAGDGPLRPKLEAAAQADPRIRILGRLTEDEKWRWLAAVDALALPSTNEGQPITILEAIAAGCPVATTRDWAPPEILDAVAVDADPHHALKAALGRRDEAQRLAPVARQKFTWDRVAERFLSLART